MSQPLQDEDSAFRDEKISCKRAKVRYYSGMATTPSTPGGNPPSSGNGNQPPLPSKPRATIVLKKSGSSPVVTPASGTSPSNPPRPGTAQLSGRTPSQPIRNPSAKIQADREALGLSAARPSQVVSGLNEAVKRAEALANREEAKRKSGGKLNANVALHVDDTGKKWAFWVRMGIAATVLLACAAGGYMVWKSNRAEINPRVKVAATRDALNDLEIAAKNMDRFEGSDPTAQAAKERLKMGLDKQLAAVEESVEKDRKMGRNPDKALMNKREFLKNLMQFKDGWGKPFEFSVTAGELAIRSTSQAEGVPTEPVKIRITGSAGKSEKEDK